MLLESWIDYFFKTEHNQDCKIRYRLLSTANKLFELNEINKFIYILKSIEVAAIFGSVYATYSTTIEIIHLEDELWCFVLFADENLEETLLQTRAEF